MEKKIAIIGAGISGLLACKHILEKGFSPIVFEARSGIGGVWSQTIESTKLQIPKKMYQFSDFAWPPSVTETFPDDEQVMEYIKAYAVHFNILPRIRFNCKVTCIDYVVPGNEDFPSWDLWGGIGWPFSPTGRWNVTVQDARDPAAPVEVYQLDFVILCIGKYSDLPNIPDFPLNSGPEVFNGKVLHSMDYAAMANDCAAELVTNKRVTIIGFQKSAVDIAAEVAERNGVDHPCTLIFRTVHWIVPDYFIALTFKSLNRFTEFMVHKPDQGFFIWLLVILLSPLVTSHSASCDSYMLPVIQLTPYNVWFQLWIFSKLVEAYLKRKQPLKKYNMVPEHGFLKQISSCMFTVLPANFYDKVEEGSLVLKKSESFKFCKNGLVIDSEETPIATDIVIFATGYKSDEKLKNIFQTSYFQKCITESLAPFYRECIHPHIPQLAILGYADSPAFLYTTEMRSKWLAHFLAGKFKLPTIGEMEADVKKWEKCMKYYANESYKRSCISVLLQIYCNDQICKDMGFNPRRKKWLLAELFAPYCPDDYKYLCWQT
ncbi:PREDICTED: probable flavin-containing monooxygenase 1 isoform X1 [Populus euphratica]|uniref:Flavin-containing monooxygenase n=1 Tax=Populus euphratica TaxID=75702 RepID=A0AAJ6Y3K5_POPEU|nr:PREDICTED: probable flavin-containing monooxygenase 1 isoform X1 [Populus euphratica]